MSDSSSGVYIDRGRIKLYRAYEGVFYSDWINASSYPSLRGEVKNVRVDASLSNLIKNSTFDCEGELSAVHRSTGSPKYKWYYQSATIDTVCDDSPLIYEHSSNKMLKLDENNLKGDGETASVFYKFKGKPGEIFDFSTFIDARNLSERILQIEFRVTKEGEDSAIEVFQPPRTKSVVMSLGDIKKTFGQGIYTTSFKIPDCSAHPANVPADAVEYRVGGILFRELPERYCDETEFVASINFKLDNESLSAGYVLIDDVSLVHRQQLESFLEVQNSSVSGNVQRMNIEYIQGQSLGEVEQNFDAENFNNTRFRFVFRLRSSFNRSGLTSVFHPIWSPVIHSVSMGEQQLLTINLESHALRIPNHSRVGVGGGLPGYKETESSPSTNYWMDGWNPERVIWSGEPSWPPRLYRLGERLSIVNILKDAGFGWVRMNGRSLVNHHRNDLDSDGNYVSTFALEDGITDNLHEIYDQMLPELRPLVSIANDEPYEIDDEIGKRRFVNKVGYFVNEFDELDQFELWNEPNLDGFWGGCKHFGDTRSGCWHWHQGLGIEFFTDMLNDALNYTRSGKELMVGSLATVQDDHLEYAQEFMSRIRYQLTDSFSFHIYQENEGIGDPASNYNPKYAKITQDYLDLANRYRIDSVSMTESAISTYPLNVDTYQRGVGLEQQAKLAAQWVLELLDTKLDRIIWFNAYDAAEVRTKKVDGWGLLRRVGGVDQYFSPKPSFHMFNRLLPLVGKSIPLTSSIVGSEDSGPVNVKVKTLKSKNKVYIALWIEDERKFSKKHWNYTLLDDWFEGGIQQKSYFHLSITKNKSLGQLTNPTVYFLDGRRPQSVSFSVRVGKRSIELKNLPPVGDMPILISFDQNLGIRTGPRRGQ